MTTMVDTFKGMGQIKLGVMALAAVALIGFFVFITMRVSAPAMSPLFSGLAMSDSARIVAELEKNGTPYELRGDGSEVLVPSDRVLRLRMTMAEQGIPSTGSIVGYEIFDRSETFGSSNFVMNVNMMRALEGELARTIASFSQVESARVHLVVPKRELFERDRQDPSASVALKLRGGRDLSKSEIAAITHLVAAAVPGLQIGRITVVDSRGRLLAKGNGDGEGDLAAADTDEYRVAYERRMEDNVERLLEKVVGAGKVKVKVAAEIDFSRVVINSEKYDPEGQVARSTQSTSEKETSSDKEGKDNVSVANQLPDANATGSGNASNRQTEKSDETTNFEISKTVENHVKESGTVNRLSVAVVVDGMYTKDAEDKETYAPRSEEEMKRIETLTRSAIGYDEKRGDKLEVMNMQFSPVAEDTFEESFFDSFRHEMEGIVQTLIIAGVAVLIILLVLRPATMHLITATASPSEKTAAGLAALSGPPGMARLPGASDAASPGSLPEAEEESLIDITNIQGRVKSSSFKKINEIVEKHPEEAINVIRQWIFREA